MAHSRGRRGDNITTATPQTRITTTRVHASPSLDLTLQGPGFTSPQKTVRLPSLSQPMADRRRYVPPTARPDVVRYSGIQRAATTLRDKPRLKQVYFSPGLRKGLQPGRLPRRKLEPPKFIQTFVDRQTKAIRVFARPEAIPLCVARKVRARVMHALKIAGGGRGKVRPPRYNEQSGMHC